jgi:hypothetical protein
MKRTLILFCLSLILLICYLGKCRLVVVLQDKTYVYDLNTVKILDAIDTVPNLKGEVEKCFFCSCSGIHNLFNVDNFS